MPVHLPQARVRSSIALVAALSALSTSPPPAVAQLVDRGGLDGTWVRVDSNYDPNNLMRIRIDGDVAILLSVPATGHRAFRPDQILWRGLRGDGETQILGSDGTYYPGSLRREGDMLHVRVRFGAEGNEQLWRRGGPDIDGDWMRREGGDLSSDGMRIRVTGDQATIRFLPPAAPRNYRVGTPLWRGIAADGTVDVMGADGRYATARMTLDGPDRILLEAGHWEGRQVWIRPSVEPIALRPPEPEGERACVDSALFQHRRDVRAGWNLSWPQGRDSMAEPMGILDYGNQPHPASYITIDLERVAFPMLGDGYSSVWQRATGSGTRWEEERDLTAGAFRARNSARTAGGLRLSDFEAYSTPNGVRYAGVWMENEEGLDWHVEFDLTGDRYGEIYEQRRRDGFRLVDVEAYTDAGELRFAGIWYRSCDNTNWRQWRNMTREQYQDRADSLSAMGFRVVDFESYRTPQGQRYAAIWERIAGAWQVRSDRTLPQFLNHHRVFTDQGYRLVDFESYATADGQRFAGVWAENEPRFRYALRPLLDDSIQAYRDRFRIPGISVAIIRQGELVYSRGFGWADTAAGIEAHARTAYPTASISKAMAGTLGAILESRGTLDLTRPTREYLDSLPVHHTHTVEQLLAKIGCVHHYSDTLWSARVTPPDSVYTRQQDAARTMWRDPLLWDSVGQPGERTRRDCTPGNAYHYSTHGFTLVGAVYEAVTGKTVARLVEEEFARPLNLRSLKPSQGAVSGEPNPRDYHLSRRYEWDTLNGRSNLAGDPEDSWKILGGGLQVDAVDLALWGWHHLSGRLLPDSIRDDRLWRPLTAGIRQWEWERRTWAAPLVGLGWEVDAAGTVAEHGGTAVGSRTDLAIYRDRGLVIAILSNQRHDPNQAWPAVHWPNTLSRVLRRIVDDHPPDP